MIVFGRGRVRGCITDEMEKGLVFFGRLTDWS